MAATTPYLGYSFPILKRERGFWTQFFGRSTIEASILMILGTRIGERVHLPTFGSRLFELVFEQEDEVAKVLAKTYVIDALRAFEPRIDIVDAEVLLIKDSQQIQITIKYVFRDPNIANVETSTTFRFSTDSGVIFV